MQPKKEVMKNHREKKKAQLISILGGSCWICGYDRVPSALEFHHLDPTTKEIGISTHLTRSLESLIDEIKKCALLCANCHREVHAGLVEVPSVHIWVPLSIEEIATYPCKGCQAPISKGIYCSTKCSVDSRRLVNWEQERDNILEMRDNKKMSFVAMAIHYGCSDKTVAKWYKKYSGVR